MKKKTKKGLIIFLSIVIFLVAIGIVGYRLAIDIAGTKAMNMMVSNQLEGMLDSGEITIEEIESIAAEELDPEDEFIAELIGEEEIPVEKKPKTEATKAEQKETVKKASEKITEKITFSEKEEIMMLISSRLTKADIQYLMSLVAGGLDSQEISDAARLAYARFTDEEIVRVKEFWHKYKASVVKKK